ncbi:Tetratricopeptide repeat-containing protein [Streptosporangium subroseum]|uniref:Tetratricopeptide repeat-containing protein n=1 Tax=Streptosporangium subroseum TaxID=106412 RepID=A0A239P4J6_9ACTN|nr:Tetratricopeptide repeat-containing protein [Streptosporangium subroseum]
MPEAITLSEVTLAERERVLGAEHPDTLTSRNNLAFIYQESVS